MSNSKRLFRCATAKKRKSKTFASSSAKRNILENFLNKHTESTNPIEATFSRPLPVQEGHMSRFVPVGYNSHASYFAEEKRVTFFEYLFHIISHTHSTGSVIKLAVFIADVAFKNGKKRNVNRLSSKKKTLILAPNTYEHSHDYMNELSEIPTSLTYKNVRATSNTNNHAIYNPAHISNISEELTPIEAKLIKSTGLYYDVELNINGNPEIIQIEKKYSHL